MYLVTSFPFSAALLGLFLTYFIFHSPFSRFQCFLMPLFLVPLLLILFLPRSLLFCQFLRNLGFFL